MNRRSYLISGLTISLGLLAGCAGDGEGASPTATATPGGEDTATATATPGGEDTATATPGDEDTATATSDENTEEPVTYGGLYVHDSDYAVEIDYIDPDSDDSGTLTGRYHGDNYYMRIEPDDTTDVFETYKIDDTTYFVLNEEECYIDPPSGTGSGSEGASSAEENSDADAQGSKPDADLNPTGTTEIDGETVYIFEVTGEDIDGTLTFYVSASTGYLRRVEGNWGTADFYSWGDTEPISKPDMECQEYSDY